MYINKIKVAIITEGVLPVPAVKGGAVGELIDCLVRQNELYNLLELTVFSVHDSEAKREAIKNNTRFIFIKTSLISRVMDKIVFSLMKIIKTRRLENFRYIFQRIEYLYKVSRHIKKNMFHSTFFEGNMTLLFIQTLLGKKIFHEGKKILHLHNNVNTIYRRDSELNSFDAIVGNSQYVLDSFYSRFNINSYITQFMIKNCVSSSLIQRDKTIDLKKKYEIAATEKIVLYVGRLTAQKGVLELIKAFSLLQFSNLTLLIVGSPLFGLKINNHYEYLLYEEVRKCKNRVIFTGYVANKDLGSYYTSVDLAVFPSLRDEAAGLTIIEALSFGAPVITTNVGGICEYVGSKYATILPVTENFIMDLKNEMSTKLSHSMDNDEKQIIIAETRREYNELVYYNKIVEMVMHL